MRAGWQSPFSYATGKQFLDSISEGLSTLSSLQVLNANAAAKAACLAAKANVDSAQKNVQTAIDFNTALGFADAFSAADSTPASDADTTAADDTTTTDANPDVAKSTIAGLDFGKCVPTMAFLGGESSPCLVFVFQFLISCQGLGGRPATEFTFQVGAHVVFLLTVD